MIKLADHGLINPRQTDYTIFSWSRAKHGTIRLDSLRSKARFIWYNGKWRENIFFTDAAEAITSDPLDCGREIPQ
jgi:hypothetical protein